MENIAPSMRLALHLRFSLERGDAIRPVLRNYLKETEDELAISVTQLLVCLEQGFESQKVISREKSPYRRALLHLIVQGWQGKAILKPLQMLEGEIQRACDIEIERLLQLLPLKMLAPLLLLQFPAFLILLLGPLLQQLLSGF